MKNLSLLATFALAMALSPALLHIRINIAAQSEPADRGTLAPDPSAETQTQNFSGTVVKAANHYV